MSWSRSSSYVLVALLAVAGLALLIGSVGAAPVDADNAPEEAEVNDSVTVEFTLTDLYEGDTPREWTLVTTTELDNVDWTIRRFDSGGDQVGSSTEISNATAEQAVSADENVARVEVTLRGNVPDIEEYNYETPEQFVLAEFVEQRPGGGEEQIDIYRTHHYTEQSREARQAIDEASSAIESARDSGGDVSSAEESLGTAISLYNSGTEFEQAIQLAERAQGEADDAQSGAEFRSLILWGIGALLLVGVIAGAVFWYKQNQDDTADPLG